MVVAPATRLHRRVVEIDSLAEFDAVASRARSMDGWRVRHVDLVDRTEALLRLRPAGALFLGSRVAPDAKLHLEAGGALVYPDVPGTPVDEYRGRLYEPDELYEGLAAGGYVATPDARIYAWSQDVGGTERLVVRALHDASIGAALDTWLAETAGPVVGVMGGHALARGEPAFADAAELGRRLGAAGLTVATGGGPGAMEAANLGAHLSGRDASVLAEALDALAAVPSFHPSVGAWAEPALAVRARWPDGAPNLGVPTWHYGHEPSNLFASHVAKYFQNSVREATLLERCTAGIVFLPGAAGTVQEIFQDACENYYADAELTAPMVLVGEQHWTERVPVWPLLSALAAGREFERSIALVDSVADAAAVIVAHASANATTTVAPSTPPRPLRP